MDEENDISIEALRAGDRREFARLVDSYSGPLHRLALKMMGSEVDAEDVLQNTFLKAFQHIGEFEGRAKLSTWIYRIASNEALMMLRKRRPETAFSDSAAAEDEALVDPVQFADWCCLPEEEFLSAESRKALDRAVQRLPETLRIVFVLRDIEGLSILETSQALGLTDTAVKTRLLRARLRLREELGSYFSERLDHLEH